jgi:hypothetical protein
MTQRYFRSAAGVYEAIRLQLDAAWGHGPGSGTVTCYEPAATAPHDADGRVLLAVRAEFCEYDAVAAMLPELLSSGAVEEIDEATYWASQPQPQSPI